MASNFVVNDFYCLNCGHKGLPLPRKRGFQHEKMHRKKLYCPFCRTEVNHIECKTYAEVLEFKEDFANGKFQEEAKNSIDFISNEKVVM